MYGGQLIAKRPDVTQRFMVAYLRAVRYYKDALRTGTSRDRTRPT